MTIDKPSSTQTHFLHFRLCQREFCIPLKRVLRVISYVKLTAVPGMPSYFSGLLNLQGKQIPVLDLLPPLREAGALTDLHYDWDGHWNASGHRAAAIATASFLEQQQLIPDREN